jgi:hypothetical protein
MLRTPVFGVTSPAGVLSVENSKGGLEPLQPSISRLRSVRHEKLAALLARFRRF